MWFVIAEDHQGYLKYAMGCLTPLGLMDCRLNTSLESQLSGPSLAVHLTQAHAWTYLVLCQTSAQLSLQPCLTYLLSLPWWQHLSHATQHLEHQSSTHSTLLMYQDLSHHPCLNGNSTKCNRNWNQGKWNWASCLLVVGLYLLHVLILVSCIFAWVLI